jgi:hypothetical protein
VGEIRAEGPSHARFQTGDDRIFGPLSRGRNCATPLHNLGDQSASEVRGNAGRRLGQPGFDPGRHLPVQLGITNLQAAVQNRARVPCSPAFFNIPGPRTKLRQVFTFVKLTATVLSARPNCRATLRSGALSQARPQASSNRFENGALLGSSGTFSRFTPYPGHFTGYTSMKTVPGTRSTAGSASSVR